VIFRDCILCLLVLIACGTCARAQNAASAQQAETLRAQLRDVEAKQVELQTRLQQIDEDLKPENIEHSVTLVGTTRPEEVRDERRRQLENERKSVQSQLDQLTESRSRLERAIATADAAAYRQGAQVVGPSETEAATRHNTSAVGQRRSPKGARHVRRRRTRHRS